MVAGDPWVLGASMAADGNPQVLRHPWVLWEPVGTWETHCFRPIVPSHGRQGWARRQSSLPSQEEAPAPRFPPPDKELGGASRRERSWLLFLPPKLLPLLHAMHRGQALGAWALLASVAVAGLGVQGKSPARRVLHPVGTSPPPCCAAFPGF